MTDFVAKLTFFMSHYYGRVERTNRTPRQFALRVNKHVSYRGKNNRHFCLFLNHAIEFKFVACMHATTKLETDNNILIKKNNLM